ncbi:MAG: DUF971 domain-containing protein [Hyphomicrobiaceae bacterium]|nr:DUF971 domain-containing protein [Hyphomicrobiaceae bacterium]
MKPALIPAAVARSSQSANVAQAAAWAQDGGAALIVRLPSRATATISAELLWTECRSAAGRRRRMGPVEPEPPADLRIIRVEAVGLYGVNIAFSDGHDRGIYPWTFLDALASRPGINDFIID